MYKNPNTNNSIINKLSIIHSINKQQQFFFSTQHKSAWLSRHAHDHFVKERDKLGLRSRSAFKLQDIANRFPIFKPTTTCIIDLGCAPGGWCQIAKQFVTNNNNKTITNNCTIIGIDLLPVDPLPGIHFIQADFIHNREFILGEINKILPILLLGNNNKQQHVITVLSDMAPNSSGDQQRDHSVQIQLCFEALKFATSSLINAHIFVCKVYQGEEEKDFFLAVQKVFHKKTIRVKPVGSRLSSVELYVVGWR
jgi:23S rRNA (uridine2552-2'-O)-methyltransferase